MPDDATVVVAAGPQTDLLPGEVDALRAYLDGGGKLLLLLDPPLTGDEPAPEGLLGLVREWGIEAGTDVVVDASGVGQLFGADASVPVAASYPFHPITERFQPADRLSPGPLGVGRVRAPPTAASRSRSSRTGPQSWQEADIDSLATGQVELDEEAGDRPGPVTIGMAVSAPAPSPADARAGEAAGDGGEARRGRERRRRGRRAGRPAAMRRRRRPASP